MATLSRRSWKLQDFQAHKANVNCLALGHKSGRVLVTGGDDKKVNLWAIGKQSCFMSLNGHLTPIECVQFNQLEELVCAGSRAGVLKVWDCEAVKLVRTLNDHRRAIKCIDFYPYGDILASGGEDATIKIWDIRNRGIIYTYTGHQNIVNSIKFSPDGQWIASGSKDATVKIYDLRVGKVLKEFNDHLSSVTCVEFHPQDFLLATGGADQSVHFFDLENFTLVSSENELSPVRCLCFNPDGECLFTGVENYLKIIGWEPSRLHDCIQVYWGRICDISTAQNQLVGASFHLNNVQVYVIDLTKCHPLVANNSPIANPYSFTPNSTLRKSFSKSDRPVSLKGKKLDVKTIEENTSGTDPEEESTANITNMKDYKEIFRGKGLARTPPPEPIPFEEPVKENSVAAINIFLDPCEPQVITDNTTEAISLDDGVNNYHNSKLTNATKYTRSKSNLDQVYLSSLSKQQVAKNNTLNNKIKPAIKNNHYHRQSSVKDPPDKKEKNSNSIKHSASEANINSGHKQPMRKHSFSRPTRNSSVPNVSVIKNINNSNNRNNNIISGCVTSVKLSPDDDIPPAPADENEFIPFSIDQPAGIDFDDFLPKTHNFLGFSQQESETSEAEGLGMLMRGHQPMLSILTSRRRHMQLVFAQYKTKDIKHSLETAISSDDISIFVDILGIINEKVSVWNLDLCVIVLSKMLELLQSKYEQYMVLGCNTLKLILKNFGPVIRNNVISPVGSFGVDIQREERYKKSVKCHEMLCQLRNAIRKKMTFPGNVGIGFREVDTLMATWLD